MECKCSLNNNYQIIGLCDIEKFNRTISQFKDNSWSQIIIPENFVLPDNSPDVKFITKVYLDIQINSTKVIKTPSSDKANVEGGKLTGKSLLVSGEINQIIIYISDTICNSNHSVKFKVSFNTCIAIDASSNLDNSQYCIYPHIEDVSIQVLDKRHLSENINLFLFAHKMTLSTDIINTFTFNNAPIASKEELVRVTVDIDAKMLTATSSGTVYNHVNNIEFELKDSTGSMTKASGIVDGGQNGDQFAIDLNSTQFEIGDLIFIEYQISRNTFLSNYPSQDDIYDMNFISNNVFKITEFGVVPYVLPNVILLNSVEGEQIFTISFDIFNQTILSHSGSITLTNPAYRGQEYFKIVLKNLSLVEKFSASIDGNRPGSDISRDIDDESFVYGDIIELTYKDDQRLQILDNPYQNSTKTTLFGTSKSFTITADGLVAIN